MWKANGTNLEMTEGDYGIALPITVSGVTLGTSDTLRITVKKFPDGANLIVKPYTAVEDNTVNLEFTEAESNLLKVGNYTYTLDWFRLGNFMCNIIPKGAFRVVDKA
jgi:hypothetical protein